MNKTLVNWVSIQNSVILICTKKPVVEIPLKRKGDQPHI